MPDASSKNPAYLLVGEILRPHGVVGEMRMRVLTSYPDRLRSLKTLYLSPTPENEHPQPYSLVSVRMHQGYVLLKLGTITSRDTADRLRQLWVMVAMEDAIPLDEGEHYLFQVIGLTVYTEDGTCLGTITDVLETGANDVYVLESEKHGEILIPATNDTILETDMDAQKMIVRLPEGLLP
jgi:16S rRNA processing protein RimM